MLRALYVVYALIVTGVVTAVTYSDSNPSSSSYRSWGNGSNYSSSGGWHK